MPKFLDNIDLTGESAAVQEMAAKIDSTLDLIARQQNIFNQEIHGLKDLFSAMDGRVRVLEQTGTAVDLQPIQDALSALSARVSAAETAMASHAASPHGGTDPALTGRVAALEALQAAETATDQLNATKSALAVKMAGVNDTAKLAAASAALD